MSEWKKITTKKSLYNEAIDELRKLPDKKSIGGYKSIYKVIKQAYVDSFVRNGMTRQLAGGEEGSNIAYGEGVYAHITLDSAIRLAHYESWSYGDVVLEMKLLGGFKNFIMFGGNRDINNLIVETYGSNLSVYDQLLKITGDANFASKWSRYGPSNMGHYQKEMRREGYNIRGMVYEWGSYSVVLPFVFSDVIPYATAKVRSGTNSSNIQFRDVYTDDNKANVAKNFDPIAQLDLINAEYSRAAVVRVAVDDNLYCVIKSNKTGGYNIIKIDEDNVEKPRPKYIIPKNIYLSEKPTAPDTENGQFMFDYQGMSWYGTVCHETAKIPAFWNPIENDWCEFSDLENVVKQMRYGQIQANESLNEEITDLTKEDFLGRKQRIVYVCAHKSDVDAIFKNGFSRQFANNNDYMHNGGALTYGDGQYGTPDLDNAANNLSRKTDSGKSDGRKYGSVIVKCVLMGSFYKFLIFDETLAKYIYKDKWQIMDQIDFIVKDPAARDELKNYCKRFTGMELYNPKNDSWSRTNHIIYNMFNNQAGFKKWTNFFRQNGIRGAVYHGHGDGYCFVCYNFSEVIPIAASYDYGKTWDDSKFDFDLAKERSFKDPDAAAKWGHRYKGLDTATPILINCNGNKFSVTAVQTFNGKYNIINNHTGRKVSPIDFDEKPTISTEGEFQFSIGGNVFYGIYDHPAAHIPAFWDPNESDWFPFNELKDHV